jgi:hypothetical protein
MKPHTQSELDSLTKPAAADRTSARRLSAALVKSLVKVNVVISILLLIGNSG